MLGVLLKLTPNLAAQNSTLLLRADDTAWENFPRRQIELKRGSPMRSRGVQKWYHY